ncbi:MAG: endonuclease MutS2 [Oscillospiraceae bacterium]|nr:endonuclease MutS2 [Oscillospiraceae bacterium]
MSLYEKSLKTIELPAVLQLLANEAVSEEGKAMCLQLQPLKDPYEVRQKLEETGAAKKLMELNGSPSFGGVKDIVATINRADRGGVLNTIELLQVAGVLRAAERALSYRSGDSSETAVDYLFYSLRANHYLENKISSSIIGPDEIADAASKELADIRRHMRLAGDRARQSLNKIISSSVMAKYLQEPIITMRNDRFVVPVKAEFRGSVPGLVHDISASGATLFVEPMSAVEANNEIRELLAKEKNEIDRILAELSTEAAQHGEDIIRDVGLLVQLDFIFAKAKLSYRLNGCEPELNAEGQMELRSARHPLLDPKKAVPIDVRLGGDFDTLVVTGPNTGGKTVTLKTIGLLSAMTLCGLHIPVKDGSTLPFFGKILADIGDEQSIEQSLSTFSSHMTTIVKVLEECDDHTLLLFDELGAGTDPTEGAALAIAVIENARSKGAVIAATTHYAELKVYALTTPGVQNASCEFDVETLRPTYRLLIGVPGKSNAFAISARLGLPKAVIEDAERRIDSESRSFEEVLQSLEQTRQELEQRETETQRLLKAAQEEKEQAEAFRKLTEEEKERAAQLARREADRILREARHSAELVFDELSEMKKKADRAEWQKLNENKTGVYKVLNDTEKKLNTRKEEAVPPPDTRPVEAGERVRLLALGTEADVISVNADGTLNLQAGIMKITAKREEVRRCDKPKAAAAKSSGSRKGTGSLRTEAVRPELDIRGLMTDEAIPIVQRFLDNARMSKLTTVTIIHGKGTGALRKAVHECLRREKGIKGFRLGVFGEGEAGVTVVELK